MPSSRTPRTAKLLVAGATMALAVTALGATATMAANESRITFVNGIPGTPIDICLKGKEVKSGLKSGHVVSKIRDNGSHKLKVFKQDYRKCKGTKLAEQNISLSYQDLTVVITKTAPKVVVFDNTAMNPPAGQGFLVLRDAADLGPATFKYLIETPIAPALDPVWTKGDQLATPVGATASYGFTATRPDQFKHLAIPKYQIIQDQKRHEWILIGTSGKNAKIVPLSRSYWPVP
jgi:hypothetical protein